MNRLLISIAAMLVALSGCISSRTVVRVEADGSAAVEQVAYWKPMEMMMGNNDLTGPAGGAGGQEVDINQLRAQCEEYAKSMGEGVTLKSIEPLKGQGGRQGAKVVYAVADINQLKLDLIPEIGPISAPDEAPRCRFEFEKTPAGGRLVIIPPPPQQPPGQDQQMEIGPEQEAMAMMMMGPMLEGVLIELQVQFAGVVTKSTARHLSPRKDALMLFRADLGALGKDRVAMKELMAMQKIKEPQEAMKKLQAAPLNRYVQFDDGERIEVEFRAGAAPRTPAPAAGGGFVEPRTPAARPDPAPAGGDDAKARSALVLARNYVLNKRPDLARQRYQAIIDQYPGTTYAEEAKKALQELPE